MLIGHKNGGAKITVSHLPTGGKIFTDIDVEVETLEERLYLLSLTPAVKTEVTYYRTGKDKPESVYTDDKGQLAIYEYDGIEGLMRFKSEVNGELYLGSIHTARLSSGEGNPQYRELYPMNNFSLRKVSSQTFFSYKPDGTPYIGSVKVTGGVFVNDKYIDNSIFPIPDPLDPGSAYAGPGGSFTVRMDTTAFVENINIGDDIRFVYEVQFLNGDWAPRIIEVQGFIDENDSNVSLADTIIYLNPWNGFGLIPMRYEYADSKTYDSTYNNDYVGPSSDDPEGKVRAYLAGATNISGVQIDFVDEYEYTPVNQTVNYLNNSRGWDFLSGDYKYWVAELVVDDGLMLEFLTPRSYELHANVLGNNIQKYQLPFQVINTVGLEVDDEFYDFSLDFTNVITDTSEFSRVGNSLDNNINTMMSSIMATSENTDGDNETLRKILHFIPFISGFEIPQKDKSNGGDSFLNKIPFSIMINRDEDNPFLYTLKAIWSPKDDINFGEGSLPQNASDALKKDFDKRYKKAMEKHTAEEKYLLRGAKLEPDIVVTFEAELGFDLKKSEWIFKITELTISFSVELSAFISASFPTPITGLWITIELSSIFDAGIKGGYMDALNNAIGIAIYVDANVRFRIAASLDIGLGFISIGAISAGGFAQMDLAFQQIIIDFSKEMYYAHPGSLEIKANAGLDAQIRVGPQQPSFLSHTWRWIIWQTKDWVIVDEKWPEYIMSNGTYGKIETVDTSIPMMVAKSENMTSMSLFASLTDQQLRYIDTDLLPAEILLNTLPPPRGYLWV